MENLANFEKKINIDFKNKDLLQQVFVHRSFLNENPGFRLDHNERLEFLGDAVLELIVTEELYKTLPNPEGELTNFRSALVRGKMLSDLSGSIGMNDYLLLSRGEQKSGGKARQLILANALEALIGAIYLDHGYDTTREFIKGILFGRLAAIIENKLYLDPKSHLQEVSQAEFGITPNYRVLNENGPDHAKIFTVDCYVGEEKVGSGNGSSKQTAESASAESALEHWEEFSKKSKN